MPSLDQALKVLPVAGAVITFIWGVWVWSDNAEKERASAAAETEKYAESRRIEATKPFLDRQLALYAEASQVAAKLATSDDSTELATAKKRFWELFWGELALVENNDVSTAMVNFSNELKLADKNASERGPLRQLSLKLAEKMRDSLAKSWNTDAWINR